jgi:ankyrin repeat protein
MSRLLLDRGCDKDATDNDGWTPLHLACDLGDDVDHDAVVRLLVGRGASLSSRDSNGETPLHRACTKGFPMLTNILIDLGAG